MPIGHLATAQPTLALASSRPTIRQAAIPLTELVVGQTMRCALTASVDAGLTKVCRTAAAWLAEWSWTPQRLLSARLSSRRYGCCKPQRILAPSAARVQGTSQWHLVRVKLPLVAGLAQHMVGPCYIHTTRARSACPAAERPCASQPHPGQYLSAVCVVRHLVWHSTPTAVKTAVGA